MSANALGAVGPVSGSRDSRGVFVTEPVETGLPSKMEGVGRGSGLMDGDLDATAGEMEGQRLRLEVDS
jgi:hypothetical protein